MKFNGAIYFNARLRELSSLERRRARVGSVGAIRNRYDMKNVEDAWTPGLISDRLDIRGTLEKNSDS